MDGLVTTLLIPLLAVVPGMVLTAVFRRVRPGLDPGSEARFFAQSLIASVIPHAVMAPWTSVVIPILRSEKWEALGDWGTWAWLIYLIFVVPTALGLTLSKVLKWDWLEHNVFGRVGWTRSARTRSAWEWIFIPESPAWLIVTLRNGKVLGGQFTKGAFASLESAASLRDLYLLKPHFIVGDGEWKPMNDAWGLWISGTDIMSVEFYEGSN